jgi:hypothetical protein
MLKRFALCISATTALLALPASAIAADVVVPRSVSAQLTVGAGATRNVKLECPATSVALNGAVRRKGSAVTVRRSTPGTDARSWSFRLAANGSGGRLVSTVLRCVRLAVPARLPAPSLDLKTLRPPAVTIPAGATVAAQPRCGSAWLATGYGLNAGSSDRVRVASAVPVAHGWNFVLENVGSASASAAVTVRCVRHTVRAGSAALRFRASRPSHSNRLGTRRSPAFAHGCGSGLFSLATGVVVDPLATIELAASGPVRRARGRFAFTRARSGDRVRSFLVCLRTDSRFQ